MGRDPLQPDATRTIHFIGDLHAGSISSTRRDKTLADIATIATPAVHVQVGDAVDNGLGSEDTTALAWLDGLPGEWLTVLGNHDIWQNVRTYADWEAAYGQSRNHTQDLGFCKLIIVGPDTLPFPTNSDTSTITLTQATLDWLDAELAAATKDCVIVCHAPLHDTVTGPNANDYSSVTDSKMQAQPKSSIDTILNNRPRAKAFISGHTHSPTNATDFIKTASVGTRNIVAVNCSALYYTGLQVESYDPLRTIYLTITADGSQFEIRCRDHGAGNWVGINGQRVTKVTVPA